MPYVQRVESFSMACQSKFLVDPVATLRTMGYGRHIEHHLQQYHLIHDPLTSLSVVIAHVHPHAPSQAYAHAQHGFPARS